MGLAQIESHHAIRNFYTDFNHNGHHNSAGESLAGIGTQHGARLLYFVPGFERRYLSG